MTNRGRHKKRDPYKGYPEECKVLKDFKTFKAVFTPEEAHLLVKRIKDNSKTCSVFALCFLDEWEDSPTNCIRGKGFLWSSTPEGHEYWHNLIKEKYERLKGIYT